MGVIGSPLKGLSCEPILQARFPPWQCRSQDSAKSQEFHEAIERQCGEHMVSWLTGADHEQQKKAIFPILNGPSKGLQLLGDVEHQ